MKKIKNFLTAVAFIAVIATHLFAQSSSALTVESNPTKMNSPETLVKNFIEDYFQWNKESNEKANKQDASEIAALAAIGITENPPPFEKIKNNSRYVEIKDKHTEEYVKLLGNIEAEYKKIIRKYCRPSYQHLGIAFGSDSAHDPKNEVIVSVKTENNKSVVKTRLMKETIGKTKYTDEYEFHLTYENNRWYLEQIYYVDEEGKYEGL
jgi:hypothetical protein